MSDSKPPAADPPAAQPTATDNTPPESMGKLDPTVAYPVRLAIANNELVAAAVDPTTNKMMYRASLATALSPALMPIVFAELDAVAEEESDDDDSDDEPDASTGKDTNMKDSDTGKTADNPVILDECKLFQGWGITTPVKPSISPTPPPVVTPKPKSASVDQVEVQD